MEVSHPTMTPSRVGQELLREGGSMAPYNYVLGPP
jgi:hypothetical protein